jgi:hypothetical protein
VELTDDLVSAMLLQQVGTAFTPAERARLKPLLETQLERLRELRELDLGPADVRVHRYMADAGLYDE